MSSVEQKRLDALKTYRTLDTAPEQAFDHLTALAAAMFDVPIALVSLVDDTRQWFKSHHGLEAVSTHRSQAFCAHAIEMGPDAVMVVEDASLDRRFWDNPSVTGAPDIRFYAGAVLTSPDGSNLGTLCVIDRQARQRPATAKLDGLRALAKIAVDDLELRRAHREAQEKQRVLELAESMCGIGRWRLDLATGRSVWSERTYSIYGVARDAFDPGMNSILGLCDPEQQAKVRSAVDAAVATKCGFALEFEIRRPDGERRYLESKALCELDDRGEVAALFGVLVDVTERARSLQTIQESEARQRSLAEMMTEQARIATEQSRRAELAEQVAGLGHWRLEVGTHHVTWSPQMYAIYGLDPAQPLDLSALLAMTEPEDQHHGAEQLERLLATGERPEQRMVRIRRADGDLRYLRGKVVAETGPDGEVLAAVGTVIDITDQKRAELKVELSEARYRLLAENASDLVLQSTREGRVTYLSPSVLRMTGYAPNELIGCKWFEMLPLEDGERVQANVAEQMASGVAERAEPLEYRFVHRDGRELWFEGRPTLTFDPDNGAVTGLTSIVRDITQQKAVKAQLKDSLERAEAAAAAKGEFLANMSHELRTPLTAVLGFSRLIGEQSELTPTTRTYLARVANGGQGLLLTVNDILEFSKLEAGQVEIKSRPASPARVATEVVDLLSVQAADKDMEIAVEGLHTLPVSVWIDPDRIRQVLLNLVGNAVKFTEVGEVRLQAEFDASNAVLKFCVTDSGQGIAEADMARLFRRFSQVDGSSTRKHGGTGLGLAICKGLVEAMGGQIGVDSTVGVGSRFWFSIPAQPAKDVASESLPLAIQGVPNGIRVLIADDNAVNRSLVRAVLSPFDVEITEACDGLEAVSAALSAPFDVILMDVRMPNLDGVSAARRIRTEAGPNDATPILAFSADVATPFAKGLFNGSVAKPVSAAALVASVCESLDSDHFDAIHDAV